MKKILLLLVILFCFGIVSAHDTTGTVTVNDLNLQRHQILVYRSNGSLLGRFDSNGSAFDFNTSSDLNIHILPRQLDLMTTADNTPRFLLSYLPTTLFIIIIFLIVIFFVGFILAVIGGLLTGKLSINA